MKEITFDALRGLDEPIRVKILPNQDPPRVFFQITSPRDFVSLCLGRPVEELPRILTILSPAQHLVSALALDNLFGVEPPPMAVNMRQALLQSLFFENHLRKFFFLISSRFNPFLSSASQGKGTEGFQSSPHILDEIMGHIALSQEAIAILGGRSDHPLTAVVGGVSRYLPKEENFERLALIAKSCLAFALTLGKFLHHEFLGRDQAWSDLAEVSLAPLSFMSLPAASDAIILRDGKGQAPDQFTPEMLFQKIGLHQESWSYEPFAYLKASSGGPHIKDRTGIDDLSYDQCFFVGPLARLNQDTPLPPLAEEERQHLLKDSGPLPRFDLPAAFWSLFLELHRVAEEMADSYEKEKLLGPEMRTLPTAMGHEGRAALESPRGLLYHHYTVDEKGLVKDIEILEPVTENNALRCLLAQKAAEIALTRNYTPQAIKQFLELVLLPF